MKVKSLLIICRQAPWSGVSAREALDLALTAGAFELPVALLFLDDGVFQLTPQQQPQQLQQKDISANLQALPLFGIEALYAAQSSLNTRGLAEQSLALPVTLLDNAAVSALLRTFDQVITL